ncbi:MAG: DUF3370 family protein, partial [Blastocatellia bacterium]|nr:DUF3370 family protein [Blastocatellia bacterium]
MKIGNIDNTRVNPDTNINQTEKPSNTGKLAGISVEQSKTTKEAPIQAQSGISSIVTQAQTAAQNLQDIGTQFLRSQLGVATPQASTKTVKPTVEGVDLKVIEQQIKDKGPLKKGDSGAAVKELQKMLGFGSGGQTGVYGDTTEKAVKEFQAANNIVQNGMVGEMTLNALKKAAGSPSSPTPKPPVVTSPVKVDPKASATVEDALPTNKLKPVEGSFDPKAPDLFIVDNPETFSSGGVLGSTIGSVKGRDPQGNAPNKYTFTNSARSYTLAQNGTGKPQRFQVVIKNESNHPIKINASGVQYMKGSKNTLGIPEGYANNPPKDQEFRGPQAIAAQSYINKEEGQNGYRTITREIKPGETVILSDLYQNPGAEVFSLLDIKATSAGQTQSSENKFSIGVVATEKTLTADQLKNFTSLPAAGVIKRGDGKSDFAGISRSDFLGRPNGVIKNGSSFRAASTIEIGDGVTKGQLLLSTKNKNAGFKDESGKISNVLPNPTTNEKITIPGVKESLPLGQAAPTNEANYGVTYNVDYTLKNSSDKPKTVQVLITSPTTGKPHNPD